MAADPIAPVEDRRIVAALLEDPPVGLVALHDRYADRLFDYAVGLLGNRDAAAEVVVETLRGAAERVRSLRDPDRLRSWLYAITRRSCLRRARSRKQDRLPAEADGLGAGLSAADREVVELTLRHGLDTVDLADVLGISVRRAGMTVARAQGNLDQYREMLLIARTGAERCGGLAELLRPRDGGRDPSWTDRIVRHVADCPECVAIRADLAAVPPPVLAPFLVAPPTLRDRLLPAPAGVDPAPPVIAASAPRRVRLDWRFITGAVACFVLLVVGISIVVQSFAPTGNAPVVDDLVRISPVVGPAITTPTPTPTLERPRPTAQVPSEPPVSVVPRVPR